MYYSTVVDIEQVWKPLSPLLRAVDEGNILYLVFNKFSVTSFWWQIKDNRRNP